MLLMKFLYQFLLHSINITFFGGEGGGVGSASATSTFPKFDLF